MPPPAIPSGPDGPAQRASAWLQRLNEGWQRLPLFLLLITSLHVAGMPGSDHGSAASQILGVIRVGAVGAVVAVLVLLSVVILPTPLKGRIGSRAGTPRPRWRYLVAACGWLVSACCFVLVSRWTGSGLPGRTVTALGIWSGAYGLVMIGRATCWGRVRALLWWEI